MISYGRISCLYHGNLSLWPDCCTRTIQLLILSLPFQTVIFFLVSSYSILNCWVFPGYIGTLDPLITTCMTWRRLSLMRLMFLVRYSCGSLLLWVSVLFLAATKQLYKWYFPSVCPSVRLSVCPSVCHTFLTMFPSSYHHEIFRRYY